MEIPIKTDPNWALEDSLYENEATSKFEGLPRQFWPQQVIDRLISREVVLRELNLTDSSCDKDLVNFIINHAKKLFAIAAGSGDQRNKLLAVMRCFQSNKLDDRSLSAEFDISGSSNLELLGDRLTALDPKLWTPAKKGRFIENQWKALVPVISTKRSNYDFKPSTILPFVEQKVESGDMVKRGAFSKVHKVSIHPGHYEDPFCPKDEELPTVFALKEIVPPDEEERKFVANDWVKESTVLKIMNQRDTKHIVRFITAFRQGEVGRGMSYYLMFEWADGGNLEDLWSTIRTPPLSPELVKEAVKQFLGLAEALFATHYDQVTNVEAGTRHGDVKPENILRFRPTDQNIFGRLKIGDWGLAKYHNTATVRRGENTNTKYGTILYEPPEVKVGLLRILGRQYDVWSMGCVVLELIIWLLYGYAELKRYRAEIKGVSLDSVPCYRTVPGGTAKIHEVVVDWMDHLAKDSACEVQKAMGELLDLVRKHLLVVELSPLKGQGTTFYSKEAESQSVPGPPQATNLKSNSTTSQNRIAMSQSRLAPAQIPIQPPPPSESQIPSASAQVPRFEVTPAEPIETQDPKPSQQTQVYRATSEDLKIALTQIFDDEDRPVDYWSTEVPEGHQRRGPRPRLVKLTQDSSGRLTTENMVKVQTSQQDRSLVSDRVGRLGVGEQKIVSNKGLV